MIRERTWDPWSQVKLGKASPARLKRMVGLDRNKMIRPGLFPATCAESASALSKGGFVQEMETVLKIPMELACCKMLQLLS